MARVGIAKAFFFFFESSEVDDSRIVAHLRYHIRPVSMRRPRRGFARGCCTTGISLIRWD
jgi:hypothetical protein